MMCCADCDTFETEQHKPDENGYCVVCSYHVSDVTEPETKSIEHAETERSDENAMASKPISKKPANEEPQRSGAVWVWVVVAVAVGGIGTAVVVLKRR